ncbi:MAG: BlaI/MecI/CopY family transcriptional regulator [Lachnospiraceae bacterium]|nr:BlaI/MecI/CopY family transcriptional regulator [Lachnospiraceae bacterium]
MDKIKYEMSESEEMIMKYLWASQEGRCFNEIMEHLNNTYQKDWKKQTINTFIKRLADKGLVSYEMMGGAKRYIPTVNKEEYKKGEAKSFLDEFYQGSVYTFLSALSGGKSIDEKTAEKLRNMLEEE